MSKTYDNTFEQIIDPENIRAAIHSAAKGKRHKKQVKYALAHENLTIARISDILINRKPFLPEIRQGHAINDGIRLKRRIIVHPSFTELIVDHALLRVIAPHFMRRFYRWSCGSIPGRGQEEMAKYICRKVKAHPEKCKYYAIMDIKQCFPSADVNAVYEDVAKIEKDERTLWLVKYKLAANKVKLDDGRTSEGGLPIGLYTSPWFVNLALTRLDHHFKDDCGIYLMVRYIDDILLAHGNRRELKRAIESASAIIARSGFRWKKNPNVRRWEHGNRGKIRFCGAHFTRDGECELHDQVFLRARRTANRLIRKRERGRRITWYDASKMISYSGRFAAFGSWNAFGTCVLQGKIQLYSMRQKVSAHDKLIAKARKEARNYVQAH